MKVLVLGVTGMLGSTLFRYLSADQHFQVWGTLRHPAGCKHFSDNLHSQLISHIDVLDANDLMSVMEQVRPELVINCVGLIKQLASAKDPLTVLPVNAMFPHQLAKMCALACARLIHISTDCVFSGRKGRYKEQDTSDAEDLYGKSKFIGELHDVSHAVTLRTSIIGHELQSAESLVDWFLSQKETIKGYEKAIFSGLPTIELARIIKEYVIPRPELSGLYHVSSAPIDKFSLLKLVAEVYQKVITIVPDNHVCIDRSLDSSRFQKITQYVPPLWPELIRLMQASR